MLEVRNLTSGYNKLTILRSLNLRAERNRITAVIGPNGAGKSTLLLSIAGALKVSRKSQVLFDGDNITGMPTHFLARRGLRLVSEAMNLFTAMSVYENLILGADPSAGRDETQEGLERIYVTFPRLRERSSQLAGTLSGGERKMLAIGRAMMGNPRLLLVDEPSLGLAPKVAHEVFATLHNLNTEGMTIVMVEQNVRSALDLASYVYVLERGEFVCHGLSAEIADVDWLRRDYLAIH